MMPWVSNRIVEHGDASLLLTCRQHRDLCWCTKNLGWVGARSIFFFGWLLPDDPHGYGLKHPVTGEFARECDCPFEDLLIVHDGYLLELDPPTVQLPAEAR